MCMILQDGDPMKDTGLLNYMSLPNVDRFCCTKKSDLLMSIISTKNSRIGQVSSS